MTSQWDERTARARALAVLHPSASEILTFYAGLAALQRAMAERAAPPAGAERSFVESIDLSGAAAAVPEFLSWLENHAPAPLAEAAAANQELDRSLWFELLRDALVGRTLLGPPIAGGPDKARPTFEDATQFILEAVLQPFAELAAKQIVARGVSTGGCPVCNRTTGLAVLREEGQGAKRMLVCQLCFTEWDIPRVQCPACHQQKFDSLPVYTADDFAHVRVEACDTCKTYVKTVDLTKDGLAVAIVDDLASVPLDLWAREQGYRRVRENLLRL